MIRPPLVFRDPINTVMLPVSYSQNVLGTVLKGHSKVCVPYPRRFLLNFLIVKAGNTKGGSITVPLTSCLTGLESAV